MVGRDGLDERDLDRDDARVDWLDEDDAMAGLEQELARDLENARSIWEASMELVPVDDGLGAGLSADGP